MTGELHDFAGHFVIQSAGSMRIDAGDAVACAGMWLRLRQVLLVAAQQNNERVGQSPNASAGSDPIASFRYHVPKSIS
jgi:hypothetical protein